MINPQNGEWYVLAYKGDTQYITVTRSKIGVVRAWHGYSDKVLSTAGGYGYDKESSVLAEACATFMLEPNINHAAGVGINQVKELVATAGGRLYDRIDAMDFIYNDIKAKKY